MGWKRGGGLKDEVCRRKSGERDCRMGGCGVHATKYYHVTSIRHGRFFFWEAEFRQVSLDGVGGERCAFVLGRAKHLDDVGAAEVALVVRRRRIGNVVKLKKKTARER